MMQLALITVLFFGLKGKKNVRTGLGAVAK
jgi:hypothetical protein